MRGRGILAIGVLVVALAGCDSALAPSPGDADDMKRTDRTGVAGPVGINIVLNTPVTEEILAELGRFGQVLDVLSEIDAVRIKGAEGDLSEIRSLQFVEAANPDAVRNIPPNVAIPVDDFTLGVSLWNLDAINVTDNATQSRVVAETGAGVYIGVLDTGLMHTWPYYFPRERIAEEYAASFQGGGVAGLNVAQQPNKWEHDTGGHGTHVTSTILGFNLGGTPVTGVAPEATVIPVKVLNQPGSGFSSVIARGIIHIANLKAGPLADHPVIINMSLGSPVFDALEAAAIDYAIELGVIVCASAGNRGETAMSFPGMYEPVISTAAAGWVGEWTDPAWYVLDVPNPTDPDDFYIVDFSSRALPGQDLDLAAPGSWVLGPYQTDQGQLNYFFLGGTSMASPHTAGTVALMAQRSPGLSAAQAEAILESTAIDLEAGCRDVTNPDGSTHEVCWGANATGSGLLDAQAAVDAQPI